MPFEGRHCMVGRSKLGVLKARAPLLANILRPAIRPRHLVIQELGFKDLSPSD